MAGESRKKGKGSHKVVVLAYDGLCALEYGIAYEAFGLPRPELERQLYEYRVCAAEPGALALAGGLSIQVSEGLEALAEADSIVLPGWTSVDHVPPQAVLTALRDAFDRGARIATICSGAFALASTGLLDGKRATTHWRYSEAFRARFPKVELVPEVLYVDEGQLLTSAGSAAGLDLCLHIIRQDYGADIANQVARRLVVPAHREGGQAQFIPKPSAPERGNLAPVLDWMRQELSRPLSLREMAQKAGMSQRTFARRFFEATGQTPLNWLLAERVSAAKDLLEGSSAQMAEIAHLCGFGAPESLRHHFRRLAGTSPSQYRRTFAKSPL
ncbi:transcriptional regulator FtrA [Rhodovibrionaceae bacterium A322]